MSKAEESDDTLMATVVRGDREAFGELVQRHQGWVRALLRGFVRDLELADDLSQDAFSRAFQHAPSYQGRGSFVGWLRRIAINLAKDSLRKRKQTKAVSIQDLLAGDIPDNQPGPALALASKLLKQELRSAIQELSEDHRQVVMLRFFDNRSLQEIAQAMHCPLGTVKSRLFNALGQIRKIIQEEKP